MRDYKNLDKLTNLYEKIIEKFSYKILFKFIRKILKNPFKAFKIIKVD